MKELIWLIMRLCVMYLGVIKIPIILSQSGNYGYAIIVVLLCIDWLLHANLSRRTHRD